MSEMPYTDQNVLDAIMASGFPFELKVAAALSGMGYRVGSSLQFHSLARSKEFEVDIVATKTRTIDREGFRVDATLQLVVECKNSGYPFILFGLPTTSAVVPGGLDPDFRYCAVNSTDDDGIPNKLAFVALEDRPTRPGPKARHHQFAKPHRFHIATVAEPNNGRLKVSIADRVRSSIVTLGDYLDASAEGWLKALPILRRELHYNPGITISFALLVHPGSHWVLLDGGGAPARAEHSSLFTSVEGLRGQRGLVVDFLSFEKLTEGIAAVEHSFDALAGHLARYLKPSPRPLGAGG